MHINIKYKWLKQTNPPIVIELSVVVSGVGQHQNPDLSQKLEHISVSLEILSFFNKILSFVKNFSFSFENFKF